MTMDKWLLRERLAEHLYTSSYPWAAIYPWETATNRGHWRRKAGRILNAIEAAGYAVTKAEARECLPALAMGEK